MAVHHYDVTIANNGTASNEVDLTRWQQDRKGLSLVGIITPAAVDAVTLFLSVSLNGGTHKPIYGTSGSARSITQVADTLISTLPSEFCSVAGTKVKLNTSGAVAAARTYTLIFSDV